MRTFPFLILASTLYALPAVSTIAPQIARVATRQLLQQRPRAAQITRNVVQRSMAGTVSQQIASHHSFAPSPSVSSISSQVSRTPTQVIQVPQSHYTMQRGFSFSHPPEKSVLGRVNLEAIAKQHLPSLRQENKYSLNILESEPAKVVPQIQPNVQSKPITPTQPISSHSNEIGKTQSPIIVKSPIEPVQNKPALVTESHPLTNANKNSGLEHTTTQNQNIQESQKTNAIVENTAPISVTKKSAPSTGRNFIEENKLQAKNSARVSVNEHISEGSKSLLNKKKGRDFIAENIRKATEVKRKSDPAAPKSNTNVPIKRAAKDSIPPKRNFIQENIVRVSANAKRAPNGSQIPRQKNAESLRVDARKWDRDYIAENIKNVKPNALKTPSSTRRPENGDIWRP
ncbi:hypothetical protein O9G_005681 [Rozella allomycis CSF55]|uniref:Uncharacterized protein n=1 Tax=Rozella allomycis (strain CSF55) TaxID=988480 RepID=A0A075ARB5_ROZAC|nr:hypothetical protein O9G_005681 [Rozella allomycis CSF55]|eukprot:EPZ32836.1 hypothetical protein O9G_005681 [Rozella allomycis CSF55]